jgi:hypothetical protein
MELERQFLEKENQQGADSAVEEEKNPRQRKLNKTT